MVGSATPENNEYSPSFGSVVGGLILSAAVAVGTSSCTGTIGTQDKASGEGAESVESPDGGTTGGSGGGTSIGDTGGSTGLGGPGGGSGGSVDRGSVTFQCDPDALPGVTPLRRLTRVQYENSLAALFSGLAPEPVADSASNAFAQLPPDGENSSVFSGNDARVTQRHVDAYFGIADSISKSVTASPSELVALAGDCAIDEPLGEDCLLKFVEAFGERAFRRPLTDAERDRYLELYDATLPGAEVFRGVLFQVLMAPQFLYHFEVDGTPIDGDESRLRLSPYELASRLSFHFWQSLPDAELLEAARDGSLETDAGFEAQVDRLFADDRTRETLRRFWHEWYQLDGFSGFTSTPAFTAFLDGESVDDELYQDMLEELDQLVDHYTFETNGTYRDVLTSNLSFTDSTRLAALYGVEPWQGSGDFPQLPDGERSGLLTRAALLVEGNELTNPIKRGAFVLRSILCEDLHPPSNLPAEALALPEADADMSTRERYELKTSPQACAGCHTSFNPFGFVLESFDALGRFRTEEKIYSDVGDLENTLPIDSAVDVNLGGETFAVTNPVEFNDQLAASPLPDECFARQYFRYTYRRDESSGDSCALSAVRDALLPGGSLKGALRAIALAPGFRERVVGPE